MFIDQLLIIQVGRLFFSISTQEINNKIT